MKSTTQFGQSCFDQPMSMPSVQKDLSPKRAYEGPFKTQAQDVQGYVQEFVGVF